MTPELHSIAWHKECLHNMMIYLNKETASLDGQRKLVNDITQAVNKRRLQVERAEREGKTKFNPDKFKI